METPEEFMEISALQQVKQEMIVIIQNNPDFEINPRSLIYCSPSPAHKWRISSLLASSSSRVPWASTWPSLSRMI